MEEKEEEVVDTAEEAAEEAVKEAEAAEVKRGEAEAKRRWHAWTFSKASSTDTILLF